MSENTERLYEQARGLEPRARPSFVEKACRGDPQLREELVSLLDQAEAADEFFDLLDEAVFSTPLSTGVAPDEGDSSGGVAVDLPTRSSYPELDVGHRIGHYRIQSLVGRGGMGMVYRAHDARLNRSVALKFLPPLSTRRKDEERLLGEARAAAALEHPNVCSVHEIGETDDGRPFIAMALYEGETLKERLRQGPVSLEEAVATAIQITRGLAAAHARGIVHRDIKPGNVMLGADGTVRILDFGIAQVTDPTLIRSGVTPGTVAYMSPEQIRGDPLDPRTDLWSLGVVLYEMLTGERPFQGTSQPTLLHAILHAHPEPLSKLREVPDPLARVVERLLQKDPGRRFGSAADVIAELGPMLAMGSASLGLLSRTRRRAALLAGSTTALVALVGAAVLLPRRVEEPLPTVREAAEEQTLRRQSRNISAYELYLRGNDPTLPRSESGVRQSLDYFKGAIAADSSYAAAYAGLALAYVRLDNWFSPGVPIRQLHAFAREAAETAVALDDSLAEGHLALARAQMAELDFVSALAEIRRALVLDPTDVRFRLVLATLHLWAGRPREALAEARRGLEENPLSPYAHVEVAKALFEDRHFDEALAQLEGTAAIQPPLRSAMLLIGRCYTEKGMFSRPSGSCVLRRRTEDHAPSPFSATRSPARESGRKRTAFWKTCSLVNDAWRLALSRWPSFMQDLVSWIRPSLGSTSPSTINR